MLTVLVEDYFHVGAFEKLIHQKNWPHFEPRYDQNTRKALDLLDEFDVKATFFILGWIAEQNPKLVRDILARGHEIASRGFYHRSVDQLTPEEFREDIRKANRAIEDAGGQKVIGYRAAEKLSYQKGEWIIDILAAEGFIYDASFLPTQNDDKNKRFARQVPTEGNFLWEFPYSTRNLGLGLLPISGGNYFRQIPYTLMRNFVSGWTRRHEEPFLMYFHVWELDPEQPRISAASSYNRIRHYRKLDKMEWIIKENLRRYEFTSIADYLNVKSDSLIADVYEAVPLVSDSATMERSGDKPREPVTIVIPCYNESDALPYLANTLRSVEKTLSENYSPSFVFVDDASSDDTRNKLDELFGSKENVAVISHEKNLGVAAAILTGLNASKSEMVCSMDCDCTYDPHELAKMIPLLSEDVDLVTASPYHRDGGVRNVPGWRLFLSKGASFLYRRVLRSKLQTYTSCFRVYRRSSFAEIETTERGFLGVCEMLGQIDLRGGKIVEHPAVLEVRLFGISKMKTAQTILGHLKLLSRLAAFRLIRKPTPIKTSLGQAKSSSLLPK